MPAGMSSESVCARVVISGYRMRDHGARSGYVHLARLMEKRGATLRIAGRWQWTVGAPLRFGIPFSGMPLYNVYRLCGELRLAAHMRRGGANLYHFLYGEAGFRHIGRFAATRGHRLLATFHLPPEKLWQRMKTTRHLHHLAGIVCVSRSQFEFFERCVPEVPRYHIPLGVDCSYFTPRAERRDEPGPRLLCVGEHLRDWRTLLGVYRRVKETHRRATLTVVTPPGGFHAPAGDDGIRVLRRLGDEQLREEYLSADVLLLPLLDGTASNTALEAMACGLPIVATRVGSLIEYLGNGEGILCARGDVEAMTSAVRSLLDDSPLRQELGLRARSAAMAFDWNAVCDRTESVYASVLA